MFSWLGSGGSDEPSEQTTSSFSFLDVFRLWPSSPEEEELAPSRLSYEAISQRRRRRRGMTPSQARRHPSVVEAWNGIEPLLEKVKEIRDECQVALEEEQLRLALPPGVDSLDDLVPLRRVDVLHFGVNRDPLSCGDYMNPDNYCVSYAACGMYQQAAELGYISEETAAMLGECTLLMNALPFRQDVSRGGKRLYPYGELKRLCGGAENRAKLMVAWRAYLRQVVVTLGNYRRLIGGDADDLLVIGWGVSGSKFAQSLDDVDGAEYVGAFPHPENVQKLERDAWELIDNQEAVPHIDEERVEHCQRLFEAVVARLDVDGDGMLTEMTLFEKYYDKNSEAYEYLRETHSEVLKAYWASPAGVARKEEMSNERKEEWEALSDEEKAARLKPWHDGRDDWWASPAGAARKEEMSKERKEEWEALSDEEKAARLKPWHDGRDAWWAALSEAERQALMQKMREGHAAARGTVVRDGGELARPGSGQAQTVQECREATEAHNRVVRLRAKLIALKEKEGYEAVLDILRKKDPATQWRATATWKDDGNIKNALDTRTATLLRKRLQIPLRGQPPAYVAADAAARTSNCIRVARPGDVIGIYWSDSPGPVEEKFYWRATVEEDGGRLYVAAPGWNRRYAFDPSRDWWVMLEKKPRKRSRGGDGLDDDDAAQSSSFKRHVADAFSSVLSWRPF